MSRPAARPRARAAGRPSADPGCAGCAQLATFRALRRAGVETQGILGCDDGVAAPFGVAHGRWAAVAGSRRVAREGRALVDAAAAAGARFLVVADRVAPVRGTALEEVLAAAGGRVVRLDLDDVAGVEARVREALDRPGAVLLSLSDCPRGGPFAAPLAVDATRCNRCGQCLSLGCPALSDGGEEAVAIDAAVCTGCGHCAPLCRSRALRP